MLGLQYERLRAAILLCCLNISHSTVAILLSSAPFFTFYGRNSS
jgi:hypothetical protein